MLTGPIRTQVDQIWNAFWSGGVSNPLAVIEQITYLLFIKRLDDLHTLEENKSRTLGTAMQRRIFPEGTDPKGKPYEDLRWSRFKNFDPRVMALLHKWSDGRGSPFPGQTHPTASVTGMPSAVKPFRTATRTWNSAT